jgi:general secretion pathway protein F/type IV pilus assembly protein PilC
MLLGAVLSIFAFAALYKRERRFRKAVDGVLLKLPVAKSILTASNLAFVSEYFSLLINVGIDILRSMEILKDSVANEVYREKLDEVKQGLLKGEGVSESFRRVPIFPSFVVRMLHVGEESGTLPEQLNYIAEEYRKRLSVLVATLGKMIEPIMLMVAGAMFAIIAAGLFLPIYDLISRISDR